MASAITRLIQSTWPDVEWSPADKPILIIDGRAVRVADIDRILEGSAAYVVGLNEKLFPKFCEHVRVESVQFYNMPVKDLAPLVRLKGLSHLAVRWNTRIEDISFLKEMSGLKTLILEDTPKVKDLSPLGCLSNLSSLMYAGGVWNKNRAETLAPIGSLDQLRELVLNNLKVESGGLRPIGNCRGLESLEVSNQFPTEDYAYLSVSLPDTRCEKFAPFVRLAPGGVGGKDVMVVGKGKPLLNSVDDADRIAKVGAAFRDLQSKFAQG